MNSGFFLCILTNELKLLVFIGVFVLQNSQIGLPNISTFKLVETQKKADRFLEPAPAPCHWKKRDISNSNTKGNFFRCGK